MKNKRIEIVDPKLGVDPPPCGKVVPWWNGKKFIHARRLHTTYYEVWDNEFKK